jgi:glutamine synthetase
MTLDELSLKIERGHIDTVLVGFPDPFGRLVGKRFCASVFLDSVKDHGTHACNYLLTVNLDMDPLSGFEVANWETGFGDFEMRPDMSTLRILPWQGGSALVICDYLRADGSPVAEAPRSVLQQQLNRLKERGWTCQCASELEFYLYNQTYSEAFANGYRNLQPSSDYRIDYHLMQTTREEPLMRAIRNQMLAAGIPVENSKGEWSRGQHEINIAYGEPMVVADRHVIFKQGVKELAEQHGKAASFLPKSSPTEAGNSCHIHLSLWQDGSPLFWDNDSGKESKLFRQTLGGLLRYSPELCLLFAPTINAYKRYQPGSWAPTRMAWATDNRTVGFRVVGHGKSFRLENRMPGADANPYLAFAAMIAAGLAGVEEGLDCGPEYRGNAYNDPALAHLPSSLRDAADLLDQSAFARRTFGDAVVDFYVRHARLEHQAFSEAVTDWELRRYFEQV